MRFTIRRKIALAGIASVTLIFLGILAVANYGISSFLEFSEKLRLLSEYQQAIGKLRVDLDRQVLLPNYFILTGEKVHAKNFVEVSQALETNLKSLKNNRMLVQGERGSLTQIEELSLQIKNSTAKLFSLSNPGENPKSIGLIKKINFQLAGSLTEYGNRLEEAISQRVKTFQKEAEDRGAFIWKLVFGVFGLFYPAILFLTLYLAHIIVRPINSVITASQRVAEGDLGQTISTNPHARRGHNEG